MRHWLVAAGVYNLAWGAAVVLAPAWTVRLLGIAPLDVAADAEPVFRALCQIWGCVGMVIGVYGIGYLIAARDPARHWPIVLVGFLGKIFGPIGFAIAAARGDLPWSMGWTLLTNDFLWWIPFALILRHARQASRSGPPSLVVSASGTAS
ncbi:MAG: BphX family protein [Phycisphaerae bacterium]|nr:BphX family protein [Phycisphaerae bacterium]